MRTTWPGSSPLVLAGEAPRALIDSYDLERVAAADENIGHSTRSTDFIAPRSAAGAALPRRRPERSRRHAEFAKRMVNSGRLSMASVYDTPLSTPDRDVWSGTARLGAPLPDAPLRDRTGQSVWLLETLGGEETILHFGVGGELARDGRSLVIGQDLIDETGLFRSRFDATPGATYLVRPDQHLAARWRGYDPALIAKASRRLRGYPVEASQ